MVNIALPMPVEQAKESSGQKGGFSYSEYQSKLSRNIHPNSNKLVNSISKYQNCLADYEIKLPTSIYEIKGEDKNTWGVRVNSKSCKSYAILSHSVDNTIIEGKEKIVNIYKRNGGFNYEKKLSREANRSLKKAKIVCKSLLGIDYLWMDQLCINQKDKYDIRNEMQNMSEYYGNATVTLIAIHEELDDLYGDKKQKARQIIQQIVNSRWFRRAWTFQEGLLSQRTLFMFDDCLVDGTWLAQYWASNFKDYYPDNFSNSEFKNTKVATPIGWVYYEDGYEPSDNWGGISSAIGLDRALEIVTKHRGARIAKDIVYSVLGLFEFGKDVNFEYKTLLCGRCASKEEVVRECSHDDNNKYKDHDPYYSWDELKECLKEIQKVSQDELGDLISKTKRISLEDKKANERSIKAINNSDWNKCFIVISNWLEKNKSDYLRSRKEKIKELKIEYQAQIIQK